MKNYRQLTLSVILLTFSYSFFGQQLDRSSLPIKTPARQTSKELDVRNVSVPERVEVKAPEGAPNVILVLVDDL
ncbi:MAG TPA: hypothetical protein P5335_08455, partial [Flavobacterium sp.]|nr:hypothetical protein [Flavobacterium sp.]HRZ74947.1 hypothetical protein [Flavobacterium sp.]